MPEVFVPLSFFATVFGILYLYYSTRNKERLALIEKGADASIFGRSNKNSIITSRIITLNIALLLMGIGLGVFLASLFDAYSNIEEDAIYPAMIFFMGGLGLFIAFNMTKKLQNEEE